MTLYKIDLGWVPLDAEGNPYRPALRAPPYQRRKPITLYQTEGLAKKYSPVKKAKPVFYEVEFSLDKP